METKYKYGIGLIALILVGGGFYVTDRANKQLIETNTSVQEIINNLNCNPTYEYVDYFDEHYFCAVRRDANNEPILIGDIGPIDCKQCINLRSDCVVDEHNQCACYATTEYFNCTILTQ
jgi:hypothetical protein